MRRRRENRPPRLFFVSQGRTALINADGTGLRYLQFDVPNQATWQPADFFLRRAPGAVPQYGAASDGPGRPFEEYYTQNTDAPLDLRSRFRLVEKIATRDRLRRSMRRNCCWTTSECWCKVVRNKAGQTFSMNLDGRTP